MHTQGGDMSNTNEITSDAWNPPLVETEDFSEETWDILDEHLIRRYWYKQNFIPTSMREDAAITYH
jgi:hypothetical protein